jgi:hypothetical protein
VFKAVIPGQSFFPEGIACSRNGSVYLVGRDLSSENRNVIYKYDGSSLTEDFVSPYEDSSFYAIDFLGECGWSVGSKKVNSVSEPFLVYYDGDNWDEVIIRNDEVGTLKSVSCIDEKGCWLLSQNEEWPYKLTLIRYINGGLEVYGCLNDIVAAVYNPVDGMIYVLRDLNSTLGGSHDWRFAISADGGKTWALEEVAFDGEHFEFSGFYGYEKSLSAVPGALYINATVDSNGVRYDGGVVKRTGPPGEGTYEPLFFSRRGPYFWDTRSIAFEDAYNGIAVGHVTSVVFDDPDWVLEDVTQENLIFEDITTGPDGYWAIAEGGSPGDALMYHP